MALSTDERVARFDDVYRAYFNDVLLYAYRRLRDRAAAEELAQEAFIVFWRQHAGVREPVRPWLYGVARHLIANEFRHRQRQPQLVELGESDAPRAAGGDGIDDVMDVRRAMLRLSAADRELIMLVAWDGLSVQEAATSLRCSALTLSVRLFRARNRLRRALGAAPDARH
ncbi:sigma-70 family RNA polymerase sigma factor [Dactylosporangium sp. AC04546]|uniref:RNA polymerase sigma factor n=1 Tax=Dactylosporangium sp. AC04546 TaxID=2862460 RepID=UPI001EDFC781|nr:sigma-70 family RNA polymerase sigma factor [Dactylosporangium sp. AC04546]WVK78248.1 sigma-70 family RNA polymerase sigma factor [Dactylosporangium sp. AC04546]